MAFCDYHPCDHCGERKTFYDADMTYEQHPDGSITYGGHQVYALCRGCSETHEIQIVQKADGAALDPLRIEQLADAICVDVAELPDRTSPDDWPEAMLVTAEELFAIICERLKAA